MAVNVFGARVGANARAQRPAKPSDLDRPLGANRLTSLASPWPCAQPFGPFVRFGPWVLAALPSWPLRRPGLGLGCVLDDIFKLRLRRGRLLSPFGILEVNFLENPSGRSKFSKLIEINLNLRPCTGARIQRQKHHHGETSPQFMKARPCHGDFAARTDRPAF